MKVLVIGAYKDGTGYSRGILEEILSLDTVGVDVVCRPVEMTPGQGEIPEHIYDLESKDLNNVDVIYQYNLPSEWGYCGKAVNVGGFAWESKILPTHWKRHISLMDCIVVPTYGMIETIKPLNRNVRNKAYPIKEHCSGAFKPINFGLPENCFKFYTIAEWTPRKGLEDLIFAYYSAFRSYDNVCLILKVSSIPSGKDIIEEIKRRSGIYQDLSMFPKIILITSRMSDEEINRIHATGDCFVTSSKGEGFCFPAWDAKAHGNITITPNHTSFMDFNPTYCVQSHYELAKFGQSYYGSDKIWRTVNDVNLAEMMRVAYFNHMNGKKINHYGEIDRMTRKRSGEQLVKIFEETLSAK